MDTKAIEIFAIALVLAALPQFASAQVVINEIMYNPKGSDTGREWIELYNVGSSDVTLVAGSATKTWRVQDGSGNNALHSLTDPAPGIGRGTLVVPSLGYLVITNDPATFVGEYTSGAFSVIKSSLSLNNTGASILLIDQTSGTPATVDSVAYTSAQGGADDGTSLQKQSDGSWIAGLPTPGAANTTTAYVASSATSSSSQSTNTSSPTTSTPASAPESSYVPPPVPQLFADGGDDRTVIVGADVKFDGRAYDRDQAPLDETATRFMWNFGDGATAEGAAVLHHFDYPGRYAVVLSIAKDRFSVSDMIAVTAAPAALHFSGLSDGSASIENRSGRDLDLSNWIIRERSGLFAAQFILPDHSLVLSGGTMRINAATLKFRATADSELDYPNGVEALDMNNAGTTTDPTSAAATAPAGPPFQATPLLSTSSQQRAGTKTPDDTADLPAASDRSARVDTTSNVAPADTALSIGAATPTSQVAIASLPFKLNWWWVGAGVLALLGGGAMFFSRGVASKEWDIIEQKD